jgi:large subunit ribosomal protein L7/L12
MFGRSAQDDVDLRSLTERVARLEATVAALEARLAALGPGGSMPVTDSPLAAAPVAPAYLEEVRALRAQGKTIQAIKVYRERTGVGLKEAKDAVERML